MTFLGGGHISLWRIWAFGPKVIGSFEISKLGSLANHNNAINMSRSSHQRCSMKKGVLKNFTKFTGKHLCQSLFFNKVAGLRPTTLLKKRLWHKCFLVNFGKFLRTPFWQNTSGRLLQNVITTTITDILGD